MISISRRSGRKPKPLLSPEEAAQVNRLRQLAEACRYADLLMDELRYQFTRAQDVYIEKPYIVCLRLEISFFAERSYTVQDWQCLLDRFSSVENEFPGWKFFLSNTYDSGGFTAYIGSGGDIDAVSRTEPPLRADSPILQAC